MGDAATLDVFGGFRDLNVDTGTDWSLTTTITGPSGETVLPRSGSVSADTELWDGIVGVGGRVKLGTGRWFLPYYADVGTGDTELTGQAVLGVGYGFHWGNVVLGYRHLVYRAGRRQAGRGPHLRRPGPGRRAPLLMGSKELELRDG